MGRQVKIEFDLYYDVPARAVPDALVVREAEGSAPATITLPRYSWPGS